MAKEPKTGKPSKLTQQDVRDTFDYDPRTGVCKWKTYRLKAAPGEAIDDRFAYNEGLYIISIKSESHPLHRLIYLWMTGEFPDGYVMHKNGNKKDNRWDNLEVCSREKISNHPERIKKQMKHRPVPKEGITITPGSQWDVFLKLKDGSMVYGGRHMSRAKGREVYLQMKVLFGAEADDTIPHSVKEMTAAEEKALKEHLLRTDVKDMTDEQLEFLTTDWME